MSKHGFARLKKRSHGKEDLATNKILHICKVYLPVRGGVQRVVHLISSSLTNFTHHILTTGEDGAVAEQTLDRAEISRCRSYGQIASMPIAPSLISKVVTKTSQHNLIALHYPFPLAELALLCSFSGTPIIVHWHSDIIAQRKLKWIVAPLTFLILLRAKAIVATSEKMIDNSFWLRRFSKKVQLIPYGMESVTPSRSLPLAPNGYFALIGRHVSYKGIDVAIRALKYCNARLYIVGDGPLLSLIHI